MPIYEYVCDDCQKRYERVVMSATQSITCPHCQSARHMLQLSVFSAGKSTSGSGSPGGSSGGSSFSGSSSGGGCCPPGGCGCH